MSETKPFSVFLSQLLPLTNTQSPDATVHAVLKCAETSRRLELKNVLALCKFEVADIPEEEKIQKGDLEMFYYETETDYGNPDCIVCESSIDGRIFRLYNNNFVWGIVLHAGCFGDIKVAFSDLISQHPEHFVAKTI